MKTETTAFYKMPKWIFRDPCYKDISTDAKVLYMLLTDRRQLSELNGWVDENNIPYEFFTIGEACKLLNFGHDKICKLFAELETADLIARKRQGLGKPSIIYVL